MTENPSRPDSSAKPSLTVDTNFVFEAWEDRPRTEPVSQLLDWVDQGLIDLVVTRRVEQDVPRDPLASRINELPELGVDVGPDVWRLGISRFPMMLGAEGFDDHLAEAIQLSAERLKGSKTSVPPDWRDWDHLHAHMVSGREYFVTSDNGILVVAVELKGWYGIDVLTPAQAVQILNQRLSGDTDQNRGDRSA